MNSNYFGLAGTKLTGRYIPVSYTHLDVYKRQIMYMLITIILIIDIEEDGLIITDKITDMILITEKKVHKGV